MKIYQLADYYEFPEFKWVVHSTTRGGFAGGGYGIGLDQTEGLWLLSYSYGCLGESISMEPILNFEEVSRRLTKVPEGLIEKAEELLSLPE